MMQKSLDAKLARIHADPRGCKDFILADAKDADMALSIGAPGRSPEVAPRRGALPHACAEFRDIIAQIVEQKLVDIMLMSASTSEVLTIQQRLFDNSPVTPAARANDTTDIHIIRGSTLPDAAVAAVPHRDARPHPVRPPRLQAGGAPARRRTWGCTASRSTTTRVLDREALEEYKAVPPRGRAQGVPPLPGGLRPEPSRGGRGEPSCRRSSTTPSSARSAA